MEHVNINAELNNVLYSSYPQIFSTMQSIQNKYQGMPAANIMNAFQKLGGLGGMDSLINPEIQNRRIKHVATSPVSHSKDEISEMIKTPEGHERELREVAHELEYSSYPLLHTRSVYQNLLTYHWMFTPDMVEDTETNKKEFWREYKLLNKLGKSINLSAFAHEVTGQALQEGKVFYYPRYMVDKSHNKVYHSFMQQLPSNYCRIIGYNNKSKYTIAFNMMYFCEVGTDPRQFGHLFDDYMEEFNDALFEKPKGLGGRLVYASKNGVNLTKVKNNEYSADAFYQSGKWYYWVVLPIDEVFTFEIDDTARTVISPFVGMYTDILQLSQLEAIQLELVQNPLVSVLTGEIPFWDSKDINAADQFKLSNGGRVLFETLWYKMLADNNTGGIGLFAAPFQNMSLHSLAESPSAMNLVTQGYTDLLSKAGLTALIPVGADARAGAVQVSLMLESQFGKTIYSCINRMMTCIIEKLRLKYEWEFKMFGDLSSDKELEDQCRQSMTLGILSAAITYNALHDRSLLDDMCWSQTVIDSDIIKKRIPLQSTFTASSDSENPADVLDKGGRPESEGVTSDGQEQDADSLG